MDTKAQTRQKSKRTAADGLTRLLTGDLYIDTSGDGYCEPIKALTRVASAQLRCIRAAMTTIGEGLGSPDLCLRDDSRGGWEPGDELTMNDAFEALGAVTALLHYGPDLLDLERQHQETAEAAE
jgi:hypothetical protein